MKFRPTPYAHSESTWHYHPDPPECSTQCWSRRTMPQPAQSSQSTTGFHPQAEEQATGSSVHRFHSAPMFPCCQCLRLKYNIIIVMLFFMHCDTWKCDQISIVHLSLSEYMMLLLSLFFYHFVSLKLSTLLSACVTGSRAVKHLWSKHRATSELRNARILSIGQPCAIFAIIALQGQKQVPQSGTLRFGLVERGNTV